MKQMELWILMFSILFCSCGKKVRVVSDDNLIVSDVEALVPSHSSEGVSFENDKFIDNGMLYMPVTKERCPNRFGVANAVTNADMSFEIPESINVDGSNTLVALTYGTSSAQSGIKCLYQEGSFKFCVRESEQVTLSNIDQISSSKILVFENEREGFMVPLLENNAISLKVIDHGAECSDINIEAHILFEN